MLPGSLAVSIVFGIVYVMVMEPKSILVSTNITSSEVSTVWQFCMVFFNFLFILIMQSKQAH